MIEDKILVHAFKRLDELPPGGTINNTDVKNWELFLECCHQYQACYGNLLLRSDKKEVKKVLGFEEQTAEPESFGVAPL